MPPHTVSADLKARIPILRRRGHSVKHICHLLGVKKTLVYKVLQLFPLVSQYRCSNQGRRHSLTVNDIAFITTILRHRPTIYLDELQQELCSRHGVFVSIPTLFRTFRRLHVNRKCISAYALERNEELHTIAEIAPDPEMLMFGDEAAKDERTNHSTPWEIKNWNKVCPKEMFRARQTLLDPANPDS
ncbi:uncharacterized protein F5891DRAFT_1125554 [Suillus fuscotomentosus]|uniref:Transposase n=1 Tax=Suillus fuscotomentosus TaxID=1912939 RepID=A0AAD4EIC5_9AGAM|nr:uncharacterized protein F5891DRAFT_1125554 [Suillus fuscotomentosus]KAG1906759.1 hypothetical protein F5891DRAFT_1125554 [Suillus fuscotomentosus]